MKVIVSGGSGFIGRRVVEALLAAGHEAAVWTRRPGQDARVAVAKFYWDALEGEPAEESLNRFDAVVNLEGDPIAKRWTPEVKRRVRDTRVLGTRRLVDAIAKVRFPPRVLISGSAIGYYGSRGDEELTEEAAPGAGFLAQLCVDWEREAERAAQFGLRVVRLRTGHVLGPGGGMLAAMLPSFLAYLGGTLGSGRQRMSWIHVDDLAAMILYALEHEVSGPWNGTAPEPVTNAAFTRALGAVIQRPAFLRVPRFALRMLYGEMADEALLSGQRALPVAAERAGFQWRYRDLGEALRACVGTSGRQAPG